MQSSEAVKSSYLEGTFESLDEIEKVSSSIAFGSGTVKRR